MNEDAKTRLGDQDKDLVRHSTINIGETPNRVVAVKVSEGVFRFHPAPPNAIRIGNDLARISLEDGTIELGEGVSATEAAMAFWEAVHQTYKVHLERFHAKAAEKKDERIEKLKEQISYLEEGLHHIEEIVGKALGRED